MTAGPRPQPCETCGLRCGKPLWRFCSHRCAGWTDSDGAAWIAHHEALLLAASERFHSELQVSA